MASYFNLVFNNWLTALYVLMVGIISLAVIVNIMKEEDLSFQIVGALSLIPLLLRFIMVK